MTGKESKYDIAKQFSAGFAAALIPQGRNLSESDHWLSGWDAGYGMRAAKSEQLNLYLVSIGHEPMGTVGIA